MREGCIVSARCSMDDGGFGRDRFWTNEFSESSRLAPQSVVSQFDNRHTVLCLVDKVGIACGYGEVVDCGGRSCDQG